MNATRQELANMKTVCKSTSNIAGLYTISGGTLAGRTTLRTPTIARQTGIGVAAMRLEKCGEINSNPTASMFSSLLFVFRPGESRVPAASCFLAP